VKRENNKPCNKRRTETGRPDQVDNPQVRRMGEEVIQWQKIRPAKPVSIGVNLWVYLLRVNGAVIQSRFSV